MPRWTLGPQGLAVVRMPIVAVGTAGNDLETPICRAPFDGYLSLAQIIAAAAYTGAATNYRAWLIRNKFGGTGVTTMARLDGLNGTNLAAFTPATIPLVATVPTFPGYVVQPTPTPTAAPVLTNGAGALTAGLYVVAYSYVSGGVEGPLSPYASIVQGGANGISVGAVVMPPGVSQVRYYFVVSPGTTGLVTTSTTGAALVLNAQGTGSLPSAFSAMDVTKGDSITCQSLHVGTGLADPGGVIELTFTNS